MIPLIFAIFADMDSAAVAALTVAADCPRQYECGGVIYEDSTHQYRVSAPLTSHKHFGLEILQYNEPIPDGWRIVADHGGHVIEATQLDNILIHSTLSAGFGH